MLKQLLFVGLGGCVGSILRYLTSVWVVKRFVYAFPLATFAVNIVGCLLIGLLVGLSVRNNMIGSDLKLLLVTGFCGGFTTFSAFSLENMRLLEAGNYFTLLLYTIGSVVMGVTAVWIGLHLTK